MIVSLNAGSRSRSSWFCLVLPCVIGLKKLVSLCQPLSNPMMTCSLLYSYLGACSSYFFNCSDWSIVLFTSVVIGHRRSGFQLNVCFGFALLCLVVRLHHEPIQRKTKTGTCWHAFSRFWPRFEKKEVISERYHGMT